MPSIAQRAFSGGEIAPALYSRADLREYQTGLRTLRNFFIRRHGGAANRPGLQFINEVKNSGARTYLFPFVFSRDQTYLIEAGVQYFRIYQNGMLQDVEGVAPWESTAIYARGDVVQSGGANYIAFQASVNKNPATQTTFWYRMPVGVYEIPTDYTQEELAGLKHVQSGDVMTFVHKNAQPSDLKRTLQGPYVRWRFDPISFTPSLPPPTIGLTMTVGGAGSTLWRYQVTSVKTETYEESTASATAEAAGGDPTLAAPNVVAWDPIPGAVEYNVYREVTVDNGVFGFIGVAASPTFNDPGIQPDESLTPPIARNPFTGILDQPGAVTYSEQRQVFAGSYNRPETIDASRVDKYHNFSKSSPLQADDAYQATLAGRTFNEIRHLLEVGTLIAFTGGGEWVWRPNADGVTLVPTEATKAHQETYYGASDVAPVVVGNNIVFIQARGNIARNLRFAQEAGGYQGDDLSINASHLFEGYAIERMDFAQAPFSLIGAVRNDGVLLALTYLPEQEIFGWSHVDTDGVFEEFTVVPEGDEDAMYAIVRRTIPGVTSVTRRYIERFVSRRIQDVSRDARFLDSHLTYDGRNLSPTAVQLTSTTETWTHHDLLQMDGNADVFVAGDEGNAIVFSKPETRDRDDVIVTPAEEVRVVISSVVSTLKAFGYPDRTVPAAFRGIETTNWAKAVDEFLIAHLDGKTVGILADGNVLARQVAEAGKVTLDRAYSVVHIGLPYTCDFETLDLDLQDLRDRKKNVRSVSLIIEASRGFWIGTDKDHLLECMPAYATAYRMPPRLETALVEHNIESTWEETGRFFVRHLDPLPLTINGAIPRIDVGG